MENWECHPQAFIEVIDILPCDLQPRILPSPPATTETTSCEMVRRPAWPHHIHTRITMPASTARGGTKRSRKPHLLTPISLFYPSNFLRYPQTTGAIKETKNIPRPLLEGQATMLPCENSNLPPGPSSPRLYIRPRCFLILIKHGAVEKGREKGRSGRDIPLLRSSIAVMKRSGAMVAVASSASALTVAASYSAAVSDPKFQSPSQAGEREEQRRSSPAADRFAPRFDGLRFIETLVTAHR